MFKISQNKGFQITFKNGWTVSVQFGPGNYCANSNLSELPNTEGLFSPKSSPNAEIAAWDSKGKWHSFGDDKVKGYCEPAEVLAFMQKIATKKGEQKAKN